MLPFQYRLSRLIAAVHAKFYMMWASHSGSSPLYVICYWSPELSLIGNRDEVQLFITVSHIPVL